MKLNKPKPEMISVFVPVDKELLLSDKRTGRKGITTGTPASIAEQYGVEMKKADGGAIFSAPKARLQLFIQKIHFSGIPYWEI